MKSDCGDPKFIYPWLLFAAPSEQSDLIRLCLGHAESNQFLVLEVYAKEEVYSAYQIANATILRLKSQLSLIIFEEFLTHAILQKLIDVIPISANTQKTAQEYIQKPDPEPLFVQVRQPQ